MDFPIKRVGSVNMHLYESDTDSDLTLVFLPGGLNPEIWQKQFRYFSKDYNVVSFTPTVSNKGFEGERECVENILGRDDLDNVILVGNQFCQSMVEEFSSWDNVVASVVTGVTDFEDFGLLERKKFELGSYFGLRKPKIFKEIFFSSFVDYEDVKDFVSLIDIESFEELRSFYSNSNIDLEGECLVMYFEKDNFSSFEVARSLESCGMVFIECAGFFGFWEKPEEFNKALVDFILKVKDLKVGRDWEKIKSENKSLKDYSDGSSDDLDRRRKEKARQLLKIKKKK